MKHRSPKPSGGPRRARRLVLCAALLASALASPPAGVVRAQQTLDRIERERAQAILNTVKDEIKKNYYDPTFRGVDLDARFKLAEEKLKQANSIGQAYGIIAQAVLDLNDSHTTFDPPALGVRAEYGMEMQMIGDSPYVVAVKPGSDAAKGLKPGDLIHTVDGFRPTRKEFWKMMYYYYALSPRAGLRFVVQSPGGQPRQVDVAAKMQQSKRVLNLTGETSGSDQDINDYIRKSEAAAKSTYHRFRKAGGVIIWKMPLFGDPEVVDKVMGEHVRGSSALILDLRDNPGGAVVTLERLAGHLFDREVKIADRKGRKEMKPMVAKRRGGAAYDGKLVVLVDSKSGSSSELLARLVQLEKRGVVIGDRSAGAVMQSRYHGRELGTERLVFYGVDVTNADVIMGDGKSLEHVGVTPDELLLPTAEDMAAGRDPVLARAAEIVGIKLDPAQAGAMFPIEWK